MRVLIIDDDHFAREDIARVVRWCWPVATIDEVVTESELIDYLSGVAVPDLITLDMKLPWCEIGPSMPSAPADVVEKGFMHGGLRCYRAIRRHQQFVAVPVVGVSAVNWDQLDPEQQHELADVPWLEKNQDEQLASVFRQLVTKYTMDVKE